VLAPAKTAVQFLGQLDQDVRARDLTPRQLPKGDPGLTGD